MKKSAQLAVMACTLAVGLIGVVASGSAMAQQPSVGVSIGINQPGVYGRINIGNYPQPVLVSPQPVIIAPQPVAVYRQPIYLYVAPVHQQNWARYCGHYNACGQPVYFVHDRWIRERYAHEHPNWREHRGHRGVRDHGDRHDQRISAHEIRHDGRRDERRDARREDSHEVRRDSEGRR